jgi:hypothetical protein
LYYSEDIRIIKSRRVKLAGHQERIEYRQEMHTDLQKRSLERPMHKWEGRPSENMVLAGFVWLRIGPSGGLL